MKPSSTLYFIKLISVSTCCYNTPVFAINWSVNPFLQTQEVYSDNIRLAPRDSQIGAFVTDVSPSISVFGQSAKTTMNLNYRMQNLYNARGDEQLSTFNQLQANGRLILVPNRFFLNSSSSISQQNISNTNIANDNISGSGNRTNVSTFSLSPTWTPRLGNYANANIQGSFNSISNDQAAAVGSVGLSDSINTAENIQLTSGREFKRITWNLGFSNNENNRTSSSANDVVFQNTSGTIRTHLNKQINLFATGSYSNNSFQTAFNNNNGFSYTLGAQWRPSNYYNIEAGYGNNRYVSLNLTPTRRLSWATTFRDNQIGLNSGQTWQSALNYRTRKSTWSLSHENDTTTTQAILLSQQQVTVDVNPDPLINQPVQFLVNVPTLTNDVIVRKMWIFSGSYFSGKSTVSARGFFEDREFQLATTKEKVSGVSANWNWRFATKTSAYLAPQWQQIDRAAPTNDNRYDVAIGLNRQIAKHINGRLEFRHLEQSSAIITNNYQENRATASLFMNF